MRVVLTGTQKKTPCTTSTKKDVNSNEFKIPDKFHLNGSRSEYRSNNNNIMSHQDLNDLATLLHEIESWQGQNSNDHVCKEATRLKKRRVITVELTCNEVGHVDEEYFERVLKENCEDEYIKVRMPNNIDSDCLLRLMAKNNTPECRRREHPKTIAEFVV